MTRERLKSPRARLFVALELPDKTRRAVVAWQKRALAPVPVLRAVPAESLHITLAFLGYRPEREIEAIGKAIETDATAPRLRFAPEPVGIPKGRPRLLALEAAGEGVAELVGAVSASLEGGGFYRREKRPFWAHLTVARVRPEARGSRRPARLEGPLPLLPEAATAPFEAVRVTLYRSTLHPSGAEYTPLAHVGLPSDAGAQ